MTKAFLISPTKEGETELKWTYESKKFVFDTKTQFIEALVDMEKGQVAVFFADKNADSRYVGILFDVQGQELFKIPFPKDNSGTPGLYFVYGWSVETDNGVKIFFKTNSVSHEDFWCEFDFKSREYTASGKSY